MRGIAVGLGIMGLALASLGEAAAGQAMPVGRVQVAGLPPPPTETCEFAAARFEGWLGDLERRLALQTEQRPSWAAFTEAARTSTAPMRSLCAAGPPMPPDTSDPAAMLASRERLEVTHLESTRLLRVAVERLAGSLTPEQRQRLGEALLPPGVPMQASMPGGPGGPGGMPPGHPPMRR